MKKTFRFLIAMLLLMAGAMNASAEEISLDEVPFWQHEAGLWGLDAPKNTEIARGSEGCAWVLGTPTGLPYGDTSVNSFADLSVYTKLVITFTEGTPRVLINRDADEGQWNADEANSHLIDNTQGGWSSKYFTTEGSVMTVDLKQIVKDKGFAHLHAIKGANWTDVTIESMMVVKEGKAKQIGWVNLINNSNMEGEDASSFFVKEAPASSPSQAVIQDGIGRDESRGIVVTSLDKVAEDYDTQFWFRFNEAIPAGTKYRVSFDYKADKAGDIGTQAHAEPSDYIHWNLFGNLSCTPDWNTFTKEGEVTADQSKADKQFLSVAFNLNVLAEANKYYFDNIKFEVYKYGTTAEFSNDVILIDFGFDTNIPEIVQTNGETRVFFPNDIATVKVNGSEVELFSIEGLKDGRLYIFLNEAVNDRDNVEVIFRNPAGAYNIVYTSGPNVGAPVADVDEIADYNSEIEDNGGYPFVFVTPVVVSADPENGSFNLPLDLREFKVQFDKNTDCSKLEADIDGQPLSVSPAEGYAQDVVFTLNGTLAAGTHRMHISKIFPEEIINEEVYGDTVYVFSSGPSDPNDVPYDIVPATYFNDCAAGSIPEGYYVIFGSETRQPAASYGSGSRMFDFAAGGDFTKGLYYREGYVQYGTVEGYPLTLEVGKKYNIHFNTAMWKDNGNKTRFEVMSEGEEVLLTQVLDNTPNVNGATSAVSGSSVYDITFAPAASGNYILRWTSSSAETGDPAYMENILANVKVSYIPAALGAAELAAVAQALESAKATQEAAAGERYDGQAFNELNAAVAKVEGEMSGYTSPSACTEAVNMLTEASNAMKNHITLCNDYDTQIKSAIDVQRQNEMPDGDPAKATKFVSTDLFGQLKTVIAKYHGSSEWVNISEDPEGEPVWQLNYSYDILKDDAQLEVATAELKDIANITSLLFTIGESAPENANGGKATGTAVLIDRLRQGAEALLSLGKSADDAAVVMANNALTDDDQIADLLKTNIKATLYAQLKDNGNSLFTPQVVQNGDFEESVTPMYNMTVFVKNPNTYKQLPVIDYTEENVPGWVTPEGFNKPQLTVGWGAAKNVEGVAEDCMFQTWGSSYRIEQTVTDLPAGVYTIVYGFGERNDEASLEGSFVYAKTSVSEEGTDGITVDAKVIGQAFPFASTSSAPINGLAIENVTVTDGQLTIGVNAGDASHTFFNDVKVYMTGAAAGFDYAGAYEEVAADVDHVTTAARVTATQLFDLNGRQMSAAKRGIVIVRKTMSDGSVKVQKIVR